MFAALLATILIVFSFFQNDTTREYRMARRMLVSSMTLLAVHFVLQIKYEIRANSDELASMFTSCSIHQPYSLLRARLCI